MKKALTASLFLLIVIALGGCTSKVIKDKKGYEMYIKVAQLTEEEKSISDLLGVNTDQRIFDFVLDDTVQSVQINTYELVNGSWKLVSTGLNQVSTAIEGRIALGFVKISDGLRVSIQSDHNVSTTSYNAEFDYEFPDMGYATSTLSDKTEITYEEEIPLVIQIITSKSEISTYNVEYFKNPEKYEKLDYEHVYAITVRFSQNQL